MSKEGGLFKGFIMLLRQVKQSFTKNIPKISDEISEVTKAIKDEYFIDGGSFGDVYGPFIWRKNQKHCVVKRSRPISSTSSSPVDLNDELQKKKEMWSQLSHLYLIGILGVFLTRQTMYIVKEYVNGGSLRKALDTHRHKFPICVVADWSRQIASGMLYLHSKDIVHRNLKSSNVLVKKPFDNKFDICDPNAWIMLKIADFDEMWEDQGTVCMTFKGALSWMAPEVLLYGHFSKSGDVWSYGVVVWEMVTGDIPHKGISHEELISKAKSETLALPLPKDIDAEFAPIINYCFGVQSDDRNSFQRILDLICRHNLHMKMCGY